MTTFLTHEENSPWGCYAPLHVWGLVRSLWPYVTEFEVCNTSQTQHLCLGPSELQTPHSPSAGTCLWIWNEPLGHLTMWAPKLWASGPNSFQADIPSKGVPPQRYHPRSSSLFLSCLIQEAAFGPEFSKALSGSWLPQEQVKDEVPFWVRACKYPGFKLVWKEPPYCSA